MNFNENHFGSLYDRHLNIGKSFSLFHYKNQIIKSYYDSSKYLHYLLRNAKADYSCFSNDGNFLAIDNIVWKMNQEMTFLESNKVIESEKSGKIEAIGFNKDSSKFLLSQSGHESSLLINDLLVDKTLEKKELINFPVSITCCPTNNNLVSFGSFYYCLYSLDLRESEPTIVEKKNQPIKNVQYHPFKDYLLLVASVDKNGLYLLDLRNKKPVFYFKTIYNNEAKTHYAKFNRNGSQIFVIRNQANPVLFDINYSYPIFEFDDYGYHLSFRFPLEEQKNCTFAGPNDEYVVTASENENVFMWEIPKYDKENNEVLIKVNKAKFSLKHNTSIFSVDYNYKTSTLVCLGNFLNFWNPLPFQEVLGKKKCCDFKCGSDVYPSFKKKKINYDEACTILKDFNYSIFLLKKNLFGMRKSYFQFYSDNFENINVKCYYTQLENDLVLNYIKSFLKDYKKTRETKKIKILKNLKDASREGFNFEERVAKKGYLDIVFELYKLILTKNFMLESIAYLKKKISKVEELKKKIQSLLNENNCTSLNEKVDSLKKIEFILKIIWCDIEIIILKDKELFENPFKLLQELWRFYSIESGYFIDDREKILKYNQEEVISFDLEEKEILSNLKIKRKFKIFDEEMKKNLNELNLNLKSKLDEFNYLFSNYHGL